MSTKTTFKRVALVAVAALGLGVLTSVAPATAAANATITSLSAGTPTPVRVGVVSSVTITAAHAADASVDNTFIAAAKVTTAPSTSKAKTDTNTASLGVTIATGAGTGESLSVANAYVVGGANATVQSTSDTAVSSTFKVKFVADVEGTYTVLVSVGNTAYTAGNQTVAVTFTTVGAPTALTLTKVAGVVTTASTTATKGAIYKLTMKDANGNATVLGQDEAIVVTNPDTTNLDIYANGAASTNISSTGSVKDYTIVVFAKTTSPNTFTAGTSTLTVTGSGLLPATLTTNTTVTRVATDAAVATDTVACTTAANCTGATGGTDAGASGTFTANVKGSVSLTIGGLSSDDTDDIIYPVFVTDSSSGTAVSYATTVTLAATKVAGTTTSVKFTAPAPSLLGTVVLDGFGDNEVTLTYVKGYAASVAVQGSASVLSATGGKNTFTVLVADQYTTALPYQSVSVSVAGRNTVAATALGVTDANGLISYSLTDAGTTGTKDTVTFSIVGGSGGVTTYTKDAVVNYGTVTVSTVTVTGGATADTVEGTTLTKISAADNGPEASYVSIKAVVKDASGNLLAGVPVTFTVDKGAIVKTAAVDYATVYTGSDGSATTRAFNWTVGKQTVTATAGGVAKTGYINWVATDASTARVLSATATGDIVSLKVVDRFGNAVAGVAISLSRTGTGLFGNGSSTQSVTTDKSGTADIRFTGSGTVVAELDKAVYTQAADVAGEIDATAVTAAVAGTTKGTGASLAPAGVAKVSVAIEESSNSTLAAAQSASDAAAEATDAANAATDAANAAAEAADAATAAAQDAADAVAALSTQVTEMVDALKKQITALTNLVIKIQKKVKA
ncbi:Big-1 (bacterial Ig-like domain 1) domain containing protein [Candidatus Nanopelagicaceae bacterium]